MHIVKIKVLISFAFTAKLICVFLFAYAKSWFSHDAAHMELNKKAGMFPCLRKPENPGKTTGLGWTTTTLPHA